MANNKEALNKWNKLDKAMQDKLLSNVFCANCHITTIIDYEITSSKPDIVIKGKCIKCGYRVTRLIENDWFNHETKILKFNKE